MKKLEFTSKEIRALEVLLWNSLSCCNSGCAYENMQDSKKDCNECEFTESVNSIENKLGLI